VKSRVIISCDVTATCCELQPLGAQTYPKFDIIGLLQLLTGDFRSNDVPFGSLPVM